MFGAPRPGSSRPRAVLGLKRVSAQSGPQVVINSRLMFKPGSCHTRLTPHPTQGQAQVCGGHGVTRLGVTSDSSVEIACERPVRADSIPSARFPPRQGNDRDGDSTQRSPNPTPHSIEFSL
ncbi:hypothetical protein L6452_09825 [Arctium lappa]|uniref:Uncharacterized protein n=1 Tax=Arctium lappa TaxID=4217 RepID=A0ACB9DMC3_ARCLA|nr:hypothetical protein L6452_09825 [Arctium lappa]